MSTQEQPREAAQGVNLIVHVSVEMVRLGSVLSATDTEVSGLSMETFVLHPAGYDGPSRIAVEQ